MLLIIDLDNTIKPYTYLKMYYYVIRINVVLLILREKEESCKRKFSGDGITFNPEYASVMLTNKTTVGELGDTSVGKNDMNDNKSKNRYVVIRDSHLITF